MTPKLPFEFLGFQSLQFAPSQSKLPTLTNLPFDEIVQFCPAPSLATPLCFAKQKDRGCIITRTLRKSNSPVLELGQAVSLFWRMRSVNRTSLAVMIVKQLETKRNPENSA